MVFKHFGTWIEVVNHFENLLIQEMDFEILGNDYNTVSLERYMRVRIRCWLL